MKEISIKEKTKHNSKIKLNLGSVIFICVLIYIVAWAIIYISKDRISFYEVTPGEMVESDRFESLILCDDKVIDLEDSGTIFYFEEEGSRVGSSSTVYCLDKTHSIKQLIADSSNQEILDEEGKERIYSELKTFTDKYDDSDFSNLYQLKSLTSTILINALSESLFNAGDYASSLQISKAVEPGMIFYYKDGLEGVTTDTFKPDMLDKTKYKVTTMTNEQDVKAGDAAYKLVTSDDWKVIFKLKKYQYEKYIQDDYVQVKFLQDNEIIWGKIDLIDKEDGRYCVLNFTNSLVRYVHNRFSDIEVIFSSKKGLKVPNSSIVVKKFYTIPKEFTENSGGTYNVFIHSVDKKGKIKIVPKELDIYDENDSYFLVNTDDFENNTEIIQKETGNSYTISDTLPINGVYNINRGYAKFNEVSILSKNDDFSIIEPNDKYGLVEYDHIVLNGEDVTDEEIVYQQ